MHTTHLSYKNFIVGVVLLLAGAGCVSSQDTTSVNTEPDLSAMQKETSTDTMVEKKSDSEKMDEEGSAMKKESEGDTLKQEAETEQTEVMKKESATAKQSPGAYEVYAPEKVARAAAQGKVVLFFHAPWCPTCKAVNTDIEANRGSIPAGVTILKVDYDSSTELKQKYGVTYQHTFVQVDGEGKLVKKWSGGLTLDDVLGNL